MTKVILAFRNFANVPKNSPDGAEFDCRKTECETVRERDARSWREMAENKKQTHLAA
jgi:hypothetical protein